MNNIIERTWKQGGMVGIEDLQGLTFQNEALAHTFKISGVDTDGNAIALSGTPSGVMLRADNTDVALTCAVSDGCVTAELPAECYDVPGRAGITIFLTSDSKKTAIYAAVVSVARTQSGTAAPGTTASVVDLVNAIETAISQIPASDTNLKGALAATYSNSALYGVGSYAWYDGKLYKCTTAITTAETWNSAHWTEAKLANDVCDLKSAFLKGYNGMFSSNVSIGEIDVGGLVPYTGKGSSLAKRCRTLHLTNRGALFVLMPLSDYDVCIWTYETANFSNPVRSITNDAYIDGTVPICFSLNNGEEAYVISFGRKDGSSMTTDTTDPTSDYSKILANYVHMILTDDTLTKKGKAADAKTTGDSLNGKLTIDNTITIEENDDLNDYVTPGVYAARSSAVAETLENTPIFDSSFKLVVTKQLGASLENQYVRQYVIGGGLTNNHLIYTRLKPGGDNPWPDEWEILLTYRVARELLMERSSAFFDSLKLNELFSMQNYTDGQGIEYQGQGICQTENNIVVAFSSLNTELHPEAKNKYNAVFVYDKETFELADIPTNPIILDLTTLDPEEITASHANNIEYLSEEKEIWIRAYSKKAIILDAETFVYKRSETMPANGGFSYDPISKEWCILNYTDDERYAIIIYNKERTKILRVYRPYVQGTTQGIKYYNSNVFIAGSPIKNGLSANSIFVQDANANAINADWWFNSNNGREFEDLDIVNGNQVMLLTITSEKSTIYIGNIKPFNKYHANIAAYDNPYNSEIVETDL